MSFKTRIRNKRDTASNWETNDPVLLDGELIVVDTNAGDIRFKIGDGAKTYTQLLFQDEVIYNALSGKAEANDLTTLEGRVTTIDGEIDILQTESEDRVVATDDGELTNVLPEMFGGRTAEEYALKTDLENVSGLPSGSKPNQYIVTDGEGNAKWEDKLCWSEEVVTKTAVLEEAEFDCVVESGYTATSDLGKNIALDAGTKCLVTFDGVEYECVSSVYNGMAGAVTRIGNLSIVLSNEENTGEPFFIDARVNNNGFVYVPVDAEGKHTVSIATVAEEETIHPIDKKYLPVGSGGNNFYAYIWYENEEYHVETFDGSEFDPEVAIGTGKTIVVQRDGLMMNVIATNNTGSSAIDMWYFNIEDEAMRRLRFSFDGGRIFAPIE